jgi:hypothetical protein
VEREMEMVLGWNGSRHQSWASPWSNSGAHIHFLLGVGDGRRSAAALLCASRHPSPPTHHASVSSQLHARTAPAGLYPGRASFAEKHPSGCLSLCSVPSSDDAYVSLSSVYAEDGEWQSGEETGTG